jgi:hypothetical protein
VACDQARLSVDRESAEEQGSRQPSNLFGECRLYSFVSDVLLAATAVLRLALAVADGLCPVPSIAATRATVTASSSGRQVRASISSDQPGPDGFALPDAIFGRRQQWDCPPIGRS